MTRTEAETKAGKEEGSKGRCTEMEAGHGKGSVAHTDSVARSNAKARNPHHHDQDGSPAPASREETKAEAGQEKDSHGGYTGR